MNTGPCHKCDRAAVWTVETSNGQTLRLCGRCYDAAAAWLRAFNIEFDSVVR